MKSYSQQVGPNLASWRIKCRPDEMVSHGENCGGLLVQDLGKDVYRASQLPEHSSGKIFCYECGHKVGKSVTRALKGERGTEEFYFPKKEEYEVRTLTFVEKGSTLRYWEWRPKMSLGMKEHTAGMLEMLKKRPLGRKYKKIPFQQGAAPRPAPKTQVFSAGDDWMIDHPKVVIRLPRAEFSKDDANIAAQSISGFRCRNYTREELVAEAMKVLPAKCDSMEVPKKNPFQNTDTIMGTHAFILCNPQGLVLFDKNNWDATSFKMIRNDMRVTHFADRRDLMEWVQTRSEEMGMPTGTVETAPHDMYDQAYNFDFGPLRLKKNDIDF